MTARTEFVAKIFPVRIRVDLKIFPDKSLTKEFFREIFGKDTLPGVTWEIGEPEYEAA